MSTVGACLVKPRLLDLFCGAGGAAMGYHRAGFEVVGVDIKPQPRYPFEFRQMDALDALWLVRHDDGTHRWSRFDVIHASPPCQAFTRAQNARQQAHLHPDLLTPTRELLEATGLPWVIENVPGAPMRADLILCGTNFGLEASGFEVRRHRWFESNVELGLAMPCSHRLPAMPVFGHNPNADFYKRYGHGITIDAKQRAMGIDWMARQELSESIPPAFTELIGHQLMSHLKAEAVA